MTQKNKVEWYNNPGLITNLIIGTIIIIILVTQSMVSNEIGGIKLFQNILNHNINYMIMFIYFVSLKTKFGKKYFDYSNILLLLFLFILFITSTLNVCRSFSLESLLGFISSFLVVIYFFHTFLKGTRIWKDLKLYKSPFNELSNEWYFSSCVVVEIILFTINLIMLDNTSILFISLIDSLYVILFSRYIYLYNIYFDSKKNNNLINDDSDSIRLEKEVNKCDKDDKKNKQKEDA